MSPFFIHYANKPRAFISTSSSAIGGVIASDCSEKMTKLIFNKAYNSLLCGTVVSVIDKESHSEITLAAEIGSDALC